MAAFGAGAKNPPWARNVSVPTGGAPGLAGTGLAGQVSSQVMAQPGVAAPAVYSIGGAQQTIPQQTIPQQTIPQQTIPQQQYPQAAQQLSNVGQLGQVGQVAVTTVTPAVALPQPGIAIPTTLATSQVATVSYPAPRLAQAQQPKQRVFTGVVTKLHDSFGFVDEDVFFQISCVKGAQPKVGDRVLVEATYNANMPFKWNATRIQLLPNQNPSTLGSNYGMKGPMNQGNVGLGVASAGPGMNPNPYGGPSVPPLMSQTPQPGPGFRSNFHSEQGMIRQEPRGGNRDRGPGRYERDRDRDRHHDRSSRGPPPSVAPPPREREREREREKERERRSPRKRSRSPRARSRSPRRGSPVRSRRPRVVPRYMVQIPKITLDTPNANVIMLKSRYQNMYIPSDFFNASFSWIDAFPAQRAFNLSNACNFHVMHKEVSPLDTNDAVLEPGDADHLYSAKVMLLTLPSIEDMYHKACALAEDPTEMRETFQHPTRFIQFLIGLKGKGEPMAIGGPWSPTLDGANPKDDPRVLINTAIRTTRALTGVDLSTCTQWYRFAEIRYHRPEEMHKGRLVPARVETVVLFLPDVWSCIPSRLDWEGLQAAYKKQLQAKTSEDTKEDSTQEEDDDDGGGSSEEKKEPTHFSDLDPKTLKVTDMRRELEARGLNSKGLKSQLIARLTKALRAEQEKEEEEAEKKDEDHEPKQTEEDKKESEEREQERKKREEEEKKRREEREKVVRERRYSLPDNPAIIVHPSTIAKSGKFDCTVMSLSVLLDYRPEDNKEHSFEVSLFAELFNEMLMRDFGFHIYKTLYACPEAVKEKEEEKDKDKNKDDKSSGRSSSKDKESSSKRRKTDDESDKEKSAEKEVHHDKEGEDEEMDHDGKKPEEEEEDKKKKDRDRRRDRDRERDKDKDKDKEKEKEKEKEKKKERQKFYTADPFLLLSFVYFDQTHCGYILDKDIEEIVHTLGLQLTRSQVRKLVQKVVSRDTLNYRKLTDKPVKEGEEKQEEVKTEEQQVDDTILARGNKDLLDCPIPGKEETPEEGAVKEERATPPLGKPTPTVTHSGLVNFMGAMVDISSVMQRLDKSEKTKSKLEGRIKDLQEELDELKSSFNSSEQNSQKVTNELQDLKSKLREQRKLSEAATSSNKKFLEVMSRSKETLHQIASDVQDALNSAVDSDEVKSEPQENGDS